MSELRVMVEGISDLAVMVAMEAVSTLTHEEFFLVLAAWRRGEDDH